MKQSLLIISSFVGMVVVAIVLVFVLKTDVPAQIENIKNDDMADVQTNNAQVFSPIKIPAKFELTDCGSPDCTKPRLELYTKDNFTMTLNMCEHVEQIDGFYEKKGEEYNMKVNGCLSCKENYYDLFSVDDFQLKQTADDELTLISDLYRISNGEKARFCAPSNLVAASVADGINYDGESYNVFKLLPLENVDSVNVYDKWKLSTQILLDNFNYFRGAESSDCIGLANGINDGGDLLSTLIVDNDARNMMKLKSYSPDYVIRLENAIAKTSREKYGSDFYAFSACHLNDTVDAVAGVLWPSGKIAKSIDGSKYEGHDVAQGFGDRKILVIVDNFTPVFYDGINTLDHTVTGDEVRPCESSVSNDGEYVLWNCVLGIDSEGEVVGLKRLEWTIPLNGEEILKREYTDVGG